MASRSLDDLDPNVAELARKHQVACLDRGVDLMIYCTLRDAQEQAALYAQGRTADQLRRQRARFTQRGLAVPAALLASVRPRPEARKLTNAAPGESLHQYGRAYDCVPIISGKPVWGTTGSAEALWKKVAAAGEGVGLEWAGRWTTFREMPHFQQAGQRSIDDLMAAHFAGAAADAMATRAGGATLAAGAGARGAAEAAADQNQAIAAALAEPNTVLLALAALPGVPDAQLQSALDVAKRVATMNPAVWRALLIQSPQTLTAALKAALWGQAPPSAGVTLGLAPAGQQRRRVPYTLAQVDTYAKVYDAYATA